MFPLPLIVSIGRSRQFNIILALAHVLGVVSIILSALPTSWQLTGTGMLVFSLASYYSRSTINIRLRCNRNGKLEIWHEPHWQAAHLADSSVILPVCTLLRVAVGNPARRHNIVVMQDSLSAEDFRRLRVWLRWRGSKPESVDAADQ